MIINLLKTIIACLVGIISFAAAIDQLWPKIAPLPKTFTNSIGQEFVLISAGNFKMGSPENELGRDKNDETQHEVTLTKSFYMQSTEVTVEQWAVFAKETNYQTEAEKNDGAFLFLKENPEQEGDFIKKQDANWRNPYFEQANDCPVTCISWNDTKAFIQWLNQKENTNKYRLPTEAEWEYSARAGTQTPFNTGDCLLIANYNGNYPLGNCPKSKYFKKTVPVKTFKANDWGLFGMHDNVWEWCSDFYGKYQHKAVIDPIGALSGTQYVIRCGSWPDYAQYCRSASRRNGNPSNSYNDGGFRIVSFGK